MLRSLVGSEMCIRDSQDSDALVLGVSVKLCSFHVGLPLQSVDHAVPTAPKHAGCIRRETQTTLQEESGDPCARIYTATPTTQ